MDRCDEHISDMEYLAQKPIFEDVADATIDRLSGMSQELLCEAIHLTPSLGRLLQEQVYEFPNKHLGGCAIKAFRGVVFRNLDFSSLGPTEKERLTRRVRIISSLYGWLRPMDIIKPYRLEFNAPVGEDSVPLHKFWKRDVTIQLVRMIQASCCYDVLNLLPADASKCIDWKLVKNFAKVWKVDFKRVVDGGELRTPDAGRLKALRGKLLRQIIQEDISDPQDLSNLESEDYTGNGTKVYKDHFQFLCL